MKETERVNPTETRNHATKANNRERERGMWESPITNPRGMWESPITNPQRRKSKKHKSEKHYTRTPKRRDRGRSIASNIYISRKVERKAERKHTQNGRSDPHTQRQKTKTLRMGGPPTLHQEDQRRIYVIGTNKERGTHK